MAGTLDEQLILQKDSVSDFTLSACLLEYMFSAHYHRFSFSYYYVNRLTISQTKQEKASPSATITLLGP